MQALGRLTLLSMLTRQLQTAYDAAAPALARVEPTALRDAARRSDHAVAMVADARRCLGAEPPVAACPDEGQRLADALRELGMLAAEARRLRLQTGRAIAALGSDDAAPSTAAARKVATAARR
ncbi:MAG: hypothetical protein AAFX81_12980 [Pseudomonadota bacterium]